MGARAAAHAAACLALWLAGLALAGCAGPDFATRLVTAATGDDLLVVAVADRSSPHPAAGGAGRADYRQAQTYGSGGDLGVQGAAAVAEAYGLQQVQAWTIEALNWRCMLYRLAPGMSREGVLERLAAGDFYILCPDNDVTREIDNARIAWAAGDIIHNRPALSRWHPDHKAAFAAYMSDVLARADG